MNNILFHLLIYQVIFVILFNLSNNISRKLTKSPLIMVAMLSLVLYFLNNYLLEVSIMLSIYIFLFLFNMFIFSGFYKSLSALILINIHDFGNIDKVFTQAELERRNLLQSKFLKNRRSHEQVFPFYINCTLSKLSKLKKLFFAKEDY